MKIMKYLRWEISNFVYFAFVPSWYITYTDRPLTSLCVVITTNSYARINLIEFYRWLIESCRYYRILSISIWIVPIYRILSNSIVSILFSSIEFYRILLNWIVSIFFEFHRIQSCGFFCVLSNSFEWRSESCRLSSSFCIREVQEWRSDNCQVIVKKPTWTFWWTNTITTCHFA